MITPGEVSFASVMGRVGTYKNDTEGAINIKGMSINYLRNKLNARSRKPKHKQANQRDYKGTKKKLKGAAKETKLDSNQRLIDNYFKPSTNEVVILGKFDKDDTEGPEHAEG